MVAWPGGRRGGEETWSDLRDVQGIKLTVLMVWIWGGGVREGVSRTMTK